METRHNFNVLALIRPPLTIRQKLKHCITFEYKSLRNFSKLTNVSHTALNAWMENPDKYPEAHQKIVNELGFDPFSISGSMIGG